MGKRMYRSVPVKRVDVERVAREAGGKVIVAIDVAKTKQFVGFGGVDGEMLVVGRWSHPEETLEFFSICEAIRNRGLVVEAAMEPSGTYGDPLRAGLLERGIDTYRVSGKRVKDASEFWDGVPSQHDVKSVHIIARLQAQGLSKRWPLRDEAQRDMAAARQDLDDASSDYMRLSNQVDALLGRHWPELSQSLSFGTATLVAVLAEIGGPAEVAGQPEKAKALMRRVGRSFLAEETISAVVESAKDTLGLEMSSGEFGRLRRLAVKAQRARAECRKAEHRIRELADEQVPQEALKMVGPAATTALIAHNVTPSKCDSAGALLKGLGLNLREKSSGKHEGILRITKRGPGIPRQLLYMAALRLINTDPIVRAWYTAKRRRDGGGRNAPKAIVAVERKLVLALWHVWRKDEPFDARRLFDVSRLDVREAA